MECISLYQLIRFIIKIIKEMSAEMRELCTKGLNIRVTEEMFESLEKFRKQKSEELGIEITRASAIKMIMSIGLKNC